MICSTNNEMTVVPACQPLSAKSYTTNRAGIALKGQNCGAKFYRRECSEARESVCVSRGCFKALACKRNKSKFMS